MNKPSQIYLLEGQDGCSFDLEDILGAGVEAEKKKKEKEKEAKKNSEDATDAEAKEEKKNQHEVISDNPISLFPIPSPCGTKILYVFKDKYNENHLFSTGLKAYDRVTKTTEVLVDCEDESAEDLSLFVYNGLFGNKWKFYEQGKKLLLPSHERAGTILNSINLETKERKKVRLQFDFEADNVSILGFGPVSTDLEHSILISKSNFYNRARLGYIGDFRTLFDSKEAIQVDWDDISGPQNPSGGLLSHVIPQG